MPLAGFCDLSLMVGLRSRAVVVTLWLLKRPRGNQKTRVSEAVSSPAYSQALSGSLG